MRYALMTRWIIVLAAPSSLWRAAPPGRGEKFLPARGGCSVELGGAAIFICWKVGRVVEGACLEYMFPSYRDQGSNP